MALNVITKIKSAIPYLHNGDVKEAFEKTLDALEQDLNEVGYENSSETDTAIEDLDAAINTFDENVAARGTELREAARVAREEADAETPASD